MSIRAYRVIKIEHAESDSFNLWHDEELRDFFDRNYDFYGSLNDDCCGISELPVEALREALKKVNMSDDTREALQRDIEAAERAGDEFVSYDCF